MQAGPLFSSGRANEDKADSFLFLHITTTVGTSNVFVSISESNSIDRTKVLLRDFDAALNTLQIPHRITTEDNSDRWWPYGTSPERVTYLAGVRNRALEPLQSSDETVRLSNNTDFTKIVFLNDIYFSWQSIVRLLATRLDGRQDLPPDYDLACAIDYGSSGVSWTAERIINHPCPAFNALTRRAARCRMSRPLRFLGRQRRMRRSDATPLAVRYG